MQSSDSGSKVSGSQIVHSEECTFRQEALTQAEIGRHYFNDQKSFANPCGCPCHQPIPTSAEVSKWVVTRRYSGEAAWTVDALDADQALEKADSGDLEADYESDPNDYQDIVTKYGEPVPPDAESRLKAVGIWLQALRLKALRAGEEAAGYSAAAEEEGEDGEPEDMAAQVYGGMAAELGKIIENQLGLALEEPTGYVCEKCGHYEESQERAEAHAAFSHKETEV